MSTLNKAGISLIVAILLMAGMLVTMGQINNGGGGGGSPTGSAGGDLGGTYPNPTVVSVADVTTGVLPAANGGSAPIFSTAVTGTSMVTAGTNTVLIGPVTMTTPAANGAYRFVIQLDQTTAGVGGTCAAGSVSVDLAYKDADTGVIYTPQAVAVMTLYNQSSASAFASAAMAATANSFGTNFVSAPREFRAASGTAIQYQVYQNVNSNCTTPPVFATRPALYLAGY